MFNIYKLILFVVIFILVRPVFVSNNSYTLIYDYELFKSHWKKNIINWIIQALLMYAILYLIDKYYFKSNEGFDASLNATGDLGYYLQYIISNDSNNNHVLQAKTYHDKFQNGSLQQSDYTTMAKFANSIVGSSSSPPIQQAAKYIIAKSS